MNKVRLEDMEMNVEIQVFFECPCEDGHAWLPRKPKKGDTIMCECCLKETEIE